MCTEHLTALIHDVRQTLESAEQLGYTGSRLLPMPDNTEVKSLCGRISGLQDQNSKLDQRRMTRMNMRLGGGDAAAEHDDNNFVHSQHVLH